MSFKNSIFILLASAVLLALELTIYFKTGMPKALNSTGLSMVAAYKFLWLMVFTGAAGILAPAAAVVTSVTQRKKLGLGAWAMGVGVVMLGYTAFSFLSAPPLPTTEIPVPREPPPVPSPPSPAPPPPTVTPSRKIQDTVEFVDSKVEAVEPGKIRVTMQFRNKSTRTITQLDYLFSFTDETQQVLLSVPMREGLFIPPGLIGVSTLHWTKAAFKDPAPFERLEAALSKGTLKAVVAVQRAELDDKSVAEG